MSSRSCVNRAHTAGSWLGITQSPPLIYAFRPSLFTSCKLARSGPGNPTGLKQQNSTTGLGPAGAISLVGVHRPGRAHHRSSHAQCVAGTPGRCHDRRNGACAELHCRHPEYPRLRTVRHLTAQSVQRSTSSRLTSAKEDAPSGASRFTSRSDSHFRTDPKVIGYTHHGGTGSPPASQSSPADAVNDPPTPASAPHSAPSHPRPAVPSSMLRSESPPAPCRCCPAGTAPPAAGSQSPPSYPQARS